MYADAMHGTLVRFDRSRSWTLPPLALVALFWATTYMLLTYRLQSLVGIEFSVLTARRLITTLAGAGLFWLALEDLVGRTGRSANPLLVIFAVIPAAIVMLAARIFLDQVLNVPPLPLYEHINWVLLWSGYFGLWVTGVLAWKLHRDRPSHVAIAKLAARIDADVRVAKPAPAAQWAWLVDAIASEAAARGSTEKEELIRALAARAGYELADDLDPNAAVHNARVQLMGQILKRLEDSDRG